MTISSCSINGQTTFLRDLPVGFGPACVFEPTAWRCKSLKTLEEIRVLMRPLADGFDLPAKPSCLSKQEGQEGGGGVRGPHTPLPIPSFLKKAQEGRRKVRKVDPR